MKNEKYFAAAAEKVERLLVKRSSTAIGTELESETVILDLEAGVYSGFDAVGTRIWQLLEQEQNVATLRTLLLDEYNVSPEQCQQDLVHFLKDLLKKNLIEVRLGED